MNANGREVKLGEFISDLILQGSILVETKTIERITDIGRGQVPNYVRITGSTLGLIIHSNKPRLEWERIVLTK